MADRATVGATAIMTIVRAQVQRGKRADFAAMHAGITDILRDFEDDVANQVRSERDPPDG